MSATLVLTHTRQDEDHNAGDTEEPQAQKPPREAELFIFDNCSKGLGLKICGGCSLDGEELYGIFVKRVLPGGLADQEGGLQGGDQILEVNGESLEGVTNDRAVSILRQVSATNHVEMVIVRDEQARAEFREIMERNSGSSFPCTPVPTDPKQTEIARKKTSVTESSGSGHESAIGPSTQQATQEGESVVTPQEQSQAAGLPQGPVVNGGVTPKHQWRGLLPSMASTPDHRGSSTRTASSGSQFSSLPGVEPSPVGYPPVLSMNNMTAMSNGSVFQPSGITNSRLSRHESLTRKLSLDPYERVKVDKLNSNSQNSIEFWLLSMNNMTAMSNGSVFQPSGITNSRLSRHESLTRKLSLEPYERVKADKLNSALRYLGIEPTQEQEAEMMSKLQIDPLRTVNYGDFVAVAREVFHLELEDRSIGLGAMLFGASDLMDRIEPPPYRHETNGGASGVSFTQLQQENEDLRHENARLEVLLREKEEEILRIRKEAQGAIHEQRELRSKVHLAAEAQKAARDMESDYEEVVHLLEGEIAQLKIQLTKQAESDPVMQKRLAVLTCQLRKAEQEKETFKVATEKLLQFAESVHESLGETNGPAPSRPLTSGEGGKTRLLGKHKRPTQTSRSVATEAKEVATSVRSMIDTQPLPFGWEETYTEDGMKYYINHLNQVTTWSHPLSNVTHLPTTQQDKKHKDDNQPGTSHDR